ncbi:hypothetical protein V1283_005877 [Bradyrhizobium sp. AZCC 2262]|uniref:hypothetical protein n=1 Tax=Bradyrhizobium sp. AZCC 2262 TaxID=3117022 RepID=UPI002FF37204
MQPESHKPDRRAVFLAVYYFIAHKQMHCSPIGFRGDGWGIDPTIKKGPQLIGDGVSDEPGLLELVATQISDCARQQLGNCLRQRPGFRLKMTVVIFSRLLYLQVVTSFDRTYRPVEIEVLDAFWTHARSRTIAIEMVEEAIQDDRGLVLKALDCVDAV